MIPRATEGDIWGADDTEGDRERHRDMARRDGNDRWHIEMAERDGRDSGRGRTSAPPLQKHRPKCKVCQLCGSAHARTACA